MGRLAVELTAVDEARLAELVEAATTDATADEVTAALTAGDTWTSARVAWLRQFHRDRRRGFDGPTGEVTRAVVVADRVVGAVRLKWTGSPGVLETGIWLTRTARGRGVGRAAMAAVLDEAAALGARVVRAETTPRNAAALAVLRHLGFALEPGGDAEPVSAFITLGAQGSAADAGP